MRVSPSGQRRLEAAENARYATVGMPKCWKQGELWLADDLDHNDEP